jgi:hypothetical protein
MREWGSCSHILCGDSRIFACSALSSVSRRRMSRDKRRSTYLFRLDIDSRVGVPSSPP